MSLRQYTLLGVVLLAACGGQELVSPNVALGTTPFVSGATPALVAVGGVLTVSGFGFSIAATEDVLIIDTTAVSASQYGLVDPAVGDQIEQLTFTLPATLAAGAYTATVLVGNNASNSFTVTVGP